MAAPLAIVFFFTALFGFMPSMEPDVAGLITTIASVILVPFILLGLGQMIAGICLLGGGRTARGFVIAFGILHLINIPLGTALGAYTLWALLAPRPPAAA